MMRQRKPTITTFLSANAILSANATVIETTSAFQTASSTTRKETPMVGTVSVSVNSTWGGSLVPPFATEEEAISLEQLRSMESTFKAVSQELARLIAG